MTDDNAYIILVENPEKKKHVQELQIHRKKILKGSHINTEPPGITNPGFRTPL
jgi:hypothetical protein